MGHDEGEKLTGSSCLRGEAGDQRKPEYSGPWRPCLRSEVFAERDGVCTGRSDCWRDCGLAVGWGRDWGQQRRGAGRTVPAAFGLRPGGDAGSGGLAFQVGHIDHADFGNVHGLYLHLF